MAHASNIKKAVSMVGDAGLPRLVQTKPNGDNKINNRTENAIPKPIAVLRRCFNVKIGKSKKIA